MPNGPIEIIHYNKYGELEKKEFKPYVGDDGTPVTAIRDENSGFSITQGQYDKTVAEFSALDPSKQAKILQTYTSAQKAIISDYQGRAPGIETSGQKVVYDIYGSKVSPDALGNKDTASAIASFYSKGGNFKHDYSKVEEAYAATPAAKNAAAAAAKANAPAAPVRHPASHSSDSGANGRRTATAYRDTSGMDGMPVDHALESRLREMNGPVQTSTPIASAQEVGTTIVHYSPTSAKVLTSEMAKENLRSAVGATTIKKAEGLVDNPNYHSDIELQRDILVKILQKENPTYTLQDAAEEAAEAIRDQAVADRAKKLALGANASDAARAEAQKLNEAIKKADRFEAKAKQAVATSRASSASPASEAPQVNSAPSTASASETKVATAVNAEKAAVAVSHETGAASKVLKVGGAAAPAVLGGLIEGGSAAMQGKSSKEVVLATGHGVINGAFGIDDAKIALDSHQRPLDRFLGGARSATATTAIVAGAASFSPALPVAGVVAVAAGIANVGYGVAQDVAHWTGHADNKGILEQLYDIVKDAHLRGADPWNRTSHNVPLEAYEKALKSGDPKVAQQAYHDYHAHLSEMLRTHALSSGKPNNKFSSDDNVNGINAAKKAMALSDQLYSNAQTHGFQPKQQVAAIQNAHQDTPGVPVAEQSKPAQTPPIVPAGGRPDRAALRAMHFNPASPVHDVKPIATELPSSSDTSKVTQTQQSAKNAPKKPIFAP